MIASGCCPPYDIVVVDNLDVIRRGVLSLQLSHPDVVRSVRCHSDVDELDFAAPPPHVVVLDYWLGRDNRPCVPDIAPLTEWGARVLLYTSEEAPVPLLEALRAGVDGLCLKNDGLDALVEGIRTVAEGRPAYSGPLARAALDDRALGARLTPAELETLNALGLGLTNAEIARSAQLAESTVNSHVESIRRKYAERLGTKVNRTRLVREGMRDGYLRRPGREDDNRGNA